MTAKKQVMSVAIDPEMQIQLKQYAKKRDISASKFIGILVEQALKLSIDEEPVVIGKGDDVIPVVLKVPKALKNDSSKLSSWMNEQTSKIIKQLIK